MTFEQMIYFQKISNTSSLNKASELLHISQPALTKQIRTLEKELGVQLLIRSKKGVDLSPEGEFFLRESNEIIHRVETLKKKISEFKMDNSLIRIGSLPSIATHFLPSIIKSLHSKGFMFEINVYNTTAEIHALFNKGKIDIGFVQDLSEDSKNNFPILIEPYYLVLPELHFWSQKSSIRLNQLRDTSMILPKYPCDIRIALEQCLKSQSIKLNNIIELNQNDSILSLVKSNLGLAILPQMMVPSLDSNLKAIMLDEDSLKRSISFITFSNEIQQLIFDCIQRRTTRELSQ